jgi:two-component system, NarL family, sensor histidine kinase ComP
VLLFFMAAWIAAVLMLINNRLRSQDAETRRQTGIIIWGMLLGIGPFFVLTVLPYILFGQEYLSGAYTILFLILLPLAYAYVIFQRRLLKVDFIINRIVVWFTLILLILIASILVFGVFVVLFNLPAYLPIYGGVVAALIALPVTSLSRVVQRQVDRVLYGSHYDFSTVTASLSHQLAQTLDRARLADLLTLELPRQMGIQQAATLLVEGNHLVASDQADSLITFSVDDEVCQALVKAGMPLRAASLWGMLPEAAREAWQAFAWGQVFAPVIFQNELQGVLILGARVSGDVYGDQDMQIIATVARQAALAANNVTLVEKLRGLAQQLVRSSDEERKRLASELHDTVLQELFSSSRDYTRIRPILNCRITWKR